MYTKQCDAEENERQKVRKRMTKSEREEKAMLEPTHLEWSTALWL